MLSIIMFKEVPCIAIKLPVARVNDSKISDRKAIKGSRSYGPTEISIRRCIILLISGESVFYPDPLRFGRK